MKSKLYFSDGRIEELPAAVAYALWLATPGTVLRTASDARPVMKWEFGG